jgi:DUF4097 and DUF4098 domain-containing protein YvlB
MAPSWSTVSLDIEGIQGDVQAALVNGAVKAGGLGGEVKLSTVNGAIEANVSRLTEAKSVNLSSVNGSIVLVVPSGASAQVRASTIHAELPTDFGLAVMTVNLSVTISAVKSVPAAHDSAQ